MQNPVNQVGPGEFRPVALLYLALFAVLLAVLHGLSTGEFYSNYDGGEVFQRHTDMQNYARHLLGGNLQNLHPLYADLIHSNPSIGPKAIKWVATVTGSLWLGSLIVSLTYIAAYGFAVPFLTYALFRSFWLSIATAIAMFALAHNAKAYGYSAIALTGMMTTSLFVIAVALLVMKRPVMSAAIIAFQVLVHPISAVFWGPLWLALTLTLCGNFSKPLVTKILPIALAATPVVASVMMVGIKEVGFFATPDPASYWLLIKANSSHTLFIGLEKYFYPVGYLGLAIAVLLLGLANRGKPALAAISRLCGLFGLGIFVAYVAFVETGMSPLVAAMLPLRFEAILYVVLILNLIETIIGARSAGNESRLLGAVYLACLFAWHAATTLYVAWLWAVLQRGIEGSLSLTRAAWFGAVGGAGSLLLLLYLPSGGKAQISSTDMDFLASIKGLQPSLVEILHAAPYNIYRFLEVASYLILLLAAWLVARGLYRMAGASVTAVLAVVLLVAAVFDGLQTKLHPSRIGSEIAAIASASKEHTSEKQVADWIKLNVPAGTRILAQPHRFWRRLTPHAYSIDNDLLSFAPYKPSWSARVKRELTRDYGVDLSVLVQSRKRLYHSITPARWTQAKRHAVARQRDKGDGYRYIIENKNAEPIPVLPVVFENEKFRISRIE